MTIDRAVKRRSATIEAVTDDAPAWLDELSLEPGPPFLPMGTRALDPADLLIVDGDRGVFLAEKRYLLREARNRVFALRSEGIPVARETARLVAGVDSLEDAALSVQEDLTVLTRHDDGWHLEGG